MSDHGIDGCSPAVQTLRDAISRVAPTPLAVLVRGETGTGKERVARALHAASDRADGPFIAVDCASLPAGLALAELFGHERGAFTGAMQARDGVVRAAHRGTLFLDEVGDLPSDAQGALLRTLGDGTVQRLGTLERHTVDVRVVSATSRDLEADVASGRFRADLRFRLAAVSLEVPPLREREDDMIALAYVLLEEAAELAGRPGLFLGDGACAAIRRHRWAGNVRELGNAMQRAAVFADGREVQAGDLALTRSDAGLPSLGVARREAERSYLEALLRGTGGNVSEAARRAGVHRTELHRLLRRHGLRGADYREP